MNPFVSHRRVDYIQFFEEKGGQIFKLYLKLNRLTRTVIFSLSPDQAIQLTHHFDGMMKRSKPLLRNDLETNIKRLGLATFRMAMAFTALHIPDKRAILYSLVCSDTDFSTALKIAATLEKHAMDVFKNLPNNWMKGLKLKFFETLPERFDRQTYLKAAAELGIKEKTAEKYISQFKPKLLDHEHNQYTKL